MTSKEKKQLTETQNCQDLATMNTKSIRKGEGRTNELLYSLVSVSFILLTILSPS